MIKRQGTLFNFGFKKSPIEGVCDATKMIYPSQAYRAISKTYKGAENYEHTEEKEVCIHS